MESSDVFTVLDESKSRMIDSLIGMCRIPALDPGSGGDGELEKVKFLEGLLAELEIAFERMDAPDDRVSSGIRPNLLARLPGKEKRTIWIVSHTDVVPPGDLSGWKHDPFDPIVEGDRVIGRGVEDNGQSVISSIYALWAVKKMIDRPNLSAGLALVADEETGSEYGISYLIRKGAFDEDDIIVVPDRFSAEGSEIEVAEKNILWIRIEVEGKQAHASTPEKGINAHRAGANLITWIDDHLHRVFDMEDPRFKPDRSTFEPTKKEANVPNVNTVPGKDVFYVDCRILPTYSTEEVFKEFEALARRAEREFSVKVTLERVQEESSPETPIDSDVVARMQKAIHDVLGAEPKLVGVGGGTCAAHFRKAGFPAVVCGTGDETAHNVNEYAIINNLLKDAKIYAALFMS
ncbi:MAG: M20 family metallo-hydrolase [Thermoplasmata archaeon]